MQVNQFDRLGIKDAHTYTRGVAGLYAIQVVDEHPEQQSIRVRLGAIQTHHDEVCFEHYDVVAVGDKVCDLILQLHREVDLDEHGVLIHFYISNARACPNKASPYSPKNKLGGIQTGRLIDISCVEVEDDIFYADES